MHVNHFRLHHQTYSSSWIYSQSWTQPYKWAKPEVLSWCACAFTTSGVNGHRTYTSLSDAQPTFQIWVRLDKNCGAIKSARYFGQRRTNTQVISYLSNAINCIGHIKYLTCNLHGLQLGQIKVIQGQRSWCRTIANGWLPIRLLLTPNFVPLTTF